jgi:hypothetical protein
MSDTNTAPVQTKDTTVDFSQYEDPAGGVPTGPSKNTPYTHKEKVAAWDAGDADWSPEEEANNDRGPSQNQGYQDTSDQNWRIYEDRSVQAPIGTSRMEYPVEDEVDWDDDALQAGDSVGLKKGPVIVRPTTAAELQYRKNRKQRNLEVQRQKAQKKEQANPNNWHPNFTSNGRSILSKAQKNNQPMRNSQPTQIAPPMQADLYLPGYNGPFPTPRQVLAVQYAYFIC